MATMTLNMTDKEMAALNDLADEKGMSKTAVMRQALRLYQLVSHRVANGERMYFSGDQQRSAEFLGVDIAALSTPPASPEQPIPSPVTGEALREALADLATAEAEYRKLHDLHGDSDMRTGRAWDRMRRKGDAARAALSNIGGSNDG